MRHRSLPAKTTGGCTCMYMTFTSFSCTAVYMTKATASAGGCPVVSKTRFLSLCPSRHAGSRDTPRTSGRRLQAGNRGRARWLSIRFVTWHGTRWWSPESLFESSARGNDRSQPRICPNCPAPLECQRVRSVTRVSATLGLLHCEAAQAELRLTVKQLKRSCD